MEFQLFIVGDEILEGRRQDKHFSAVLERLGPRGHRLTGAHYLPDDPEALTAAFCKTLADGAHVISCGGIGATPDDHTRQALASAANVALELNDDAARLIVERHGDAAHPHRIRMAEFPLGAHLIPNPVNQVAGCSFRHHYLLPGFPEMAWPMLEWVLDTQYTPGEAGVRRSLLVPDAREGDLIEEMERLVARYPDVRFSCLPSFGNARHAGPHLEFTLTGIQPEVDAAYDYLCRALLARDYRPET
ncbi:competence/damage-inducible protein A [Chitiniphilus eburneus]|uniref:Competence/damage-inducible protein A n=1 Tax=Chitiniphilus eburneus TaxID=2571148 RepID=A0A4U0QBS6_9NEIS|nr:molybdopterin-binding protein [Chitiniphilus eburneus]TJZ78746.1 competence/damage-inducible protein A [Chitiniphilus eburneus]